MTLKDLRESVRAHLMAIPNFIAVCREIEFGRIEIVIQSGRAVQINIVMTERDTEKKAIG